MTSEAIKPCPFCGAHRGYAAPPALGKGRWVIQCDDCRAEGPTSRDNSDRGEAEAIAAWNTRTDHTADLLTALQTFVGFGCPVCNGDCASANPPVIFCPMQAARAAIARVGV